MFYSPIPDDDWRPLPEEAEKYFYAYIDESSQTQERYLILGGLVAPFSHAAN